MRRRALALFAILIFVLAGEIATRLPAMAATALPSCKKDPKFVASAGEIDLGETPQGTFVWSGKMNPIALDPGTYVIGVYAGSKRKDGKNGHYPYFPHGSLPNSVARPGYRMMITVTHVADADGRTYTSIPNGCIM
jgi:hypothetical protein